MKRKVSKETPLASITLRKYEKPYKLSGRELTKKLCLSIGLLQPADSRDVIVDVLQVILDAREPISSKMIEERVVEQRKKHKLPLQGVAGSNIRRQIKRLKDIYLIERAGSAYRIAENAKLSEIFTQKIQDFHVKNILERVKEYFEAVDNKK